ncbi:MAG: hypothetical protein MJ131_08425 [Lachnospiraceae bacterium]|nr:hypothetical protein [Lachnospiraceae bacterium]
MRKGIGSLLVTLLLMTVGFFSVNVEAATAVKKEINSSFSDFLAEEKSENWYKLTTGENTYMVFSFSAEEIVNHGWNISIYNDEYELIRSYKGIKDNFISDRFMFDDYSTFYLKVEGQYKDNWCPCGVEYTMSTSETIDKLFEKESNNVMKKANTLTSGKEKYGTLWTEKDIDYYKFKTTKTGYTQIEFHSESGEVINHGWNLSIFDSTGKLIKKTEGIKENFKSLKLDFKKGTIFYVLVEGQYKDNWSPVDKLYSIMAKEVKTTSYEEESNNTVKKATLLQKKKYGTTYVKDDIDYYKYLAKATKKVTVKFTLEDDEIVNHGWSVNIYDGTVSEKYLVAHDNAVVNDVSFKFKAKKGHNYYIVVEPRYKDNWAPIDITYMVSAS